MSDQPVASRRSLLRPLALVAGVFVLVGLLWMTWLWRSAPLHPRTLVFRPA